MVDVGRGVHPARGRHRSPADEELAPGAPGDRGPGRPRPGVGRHHQGGGGRGRRRRPGRPWSTTSPRRCGRWRPRHGVGWVAMHRQGTPATMQDDPRYDDVVAEVAALLAERAGRPPRPGCGEVWIDPGIGFGKTVDHNLSLLAALRDAGRRAGYPVLVGTSRKSFLGRPGGRDRTGRPVPVDERLAGLVGHGRVGHGRRGRGWSGSTTWPPRCRPPAGRVGPVAADRTLQTGSREGQVGRGHPAA